MNRLFFVLVVMICYLFPFHAEARSTGPGGYGVQSCVTDDSGIAGQLIDSVSGAVSGAASYVLTATGYLVDAAAYIIVPAVIGSTVCALPAIEMARVEEKHWSTGQVSGFGGLVCFQELVKRMDPEQYVPKLGPKAFYSTANWRCRLFQ